MKPYTLETLPSPCWVLEEEKLLNNLAIFKNIKEQTGAKILLALKGFAMWSSFAPIKEVLDGCCASGLHEAILAHEEFGKEVHTYSPAFIEKEFEQIASLSNHIVFNHPSQLKRFGTKAKEINSTIELGMRINPQYSCAPSQQYNPCGSYSRLGATKEIIKQCDISQLDGLHFHALCEEGAEALERVLVEVERQFKEHFTGLKWLNFGGGHHITKKGYNLALLTDLINYFSTKYDLQIYLEPGEAVGWECGYLKTTVLDIITNEKKIAILDSCKEAHMPDTVIMPYRSDVRGDEPSNPYSYLLTGNSCLAGDVMGEYRFKKPLSIGDTVIFEDQIHYTMVKATTFNGINLPSIAIKRINGEFELIKSFGYEEFKTRLS